MTELLGKELPLEETPGYYWYVSEDLNIIIKGENKTDPVVTTPVVITAYEISLMNASLAQHA